MSAFHRSLSLVLLITCSALGQTPAPAEKKPDFKTQAWQLIQDGVHDEKAERRVIAVRVLSLLTERPDAVTMALAAFGDDKPEVRVAAAFALGQLHAPSAIPKLKDALGDADPSVVVASANALLLLKDKSGYGIYYAILSGEMKAGKGLIAGQMDTLKDPKKMAHMGFEEGIGFVPYAGLGYNAVRTIMKDDSSPVRAAAARVLANDPDPDADSVLADAAVSDKSEVVRAAALDSISRRGRPVMIEKIFPAMSDDKDPVKYTAAAAIVHLSDIAEAKPAKKAPKAKTK